MKGNIKGNNMREQGPCVTVAPAWRCNFLFAQQKHEQVINFERQGAARSTSQDHFMLERFAIASERRRERDTQTGVQVA
jgi:hypothetical protein